MSELSIQEIVPSGFRELNYREADGISVALVWKPEDDSLSVLVDDAKAETAFEVSVTPETAVQVFEHPYAYAALSSDLVGMLPDFPQAA
ncbi:MAG TPA: hypothetical protein VFH37_03645 [Candidatus Saccharimonadales bacterium]|nr:hypothetical protein [Candidatus Saccharimonadales bacterium]